MDTAGTPAPAAPQQAGPGSIAMIRTLGGVALMSGLLLALVYQGTKGIIDQNKAEALRKAVFAVIPGADDATALQKRFELQNGALTPVEGAPTGAPQVYAVYDKASGTLMGAALEGHAVGYAGTIKALYGYAPDTQKIIGFNVLECMETPGLGDKIRREPFVDNFTAMDVALNADQTALAHPIELVKNGAKTKPWQIDGISGATISSRAVTKLLQDSTAEMLPVVQANLSTLKDAGS